MKKQIKLFMLVGILMGSGTAKAFLKEAAVFSCMALPFVLANQQQNNVKKAYNELSDERKKAAEDQVLNAVFIYFNFNAAERQEYQLSQDDYFRFFRDPSNLIEFCAQAKTYVLPKDVVLYFEVKNSDGKCDYLESCPITPDQRTVIEHRLMTTLAYEHAQK